MPYLVLPMSTYWLLAPLCLVVLLWVKTSLDYGYDAALHSVHNLTIITAAVLIILLAAALLVAAEYKLI